MEFTDEELRKIYRESHDAVMPEDDGPVPIEEGPPYIFQFAVDAGLRAVAEAAYRKGYDHGSAEALLEE